MDIPNVVMLQRVEQFTHEDFNVPVSVYNEMIAVQANRLPVSVTGQAIPGANYWDITLPSGAAVMAIDGYHLIGKKGVITLDGLELFTITKSDMDILHCTVMLDNKLYTHQLTALTVAVAAADDLVDEMSEVDALDTPPTVRKWHAEYDDDGASVFMDDEIAFRFDVQTMTVTV